MGSRPGGELLDLIFTVRLAADHPSDDEDPEFHRFFILLARLLDAMRADLRVLQTKPSSALGSSRRWRLGLRELSPATAIAKDGDVPLAAKMTLAARPASSSSTK